MDRQRGIPYGGTLLNTGTVLAGSTLGLALGSWLPAEIQTVALAGIGLVVVGIGIKMFLATNNVLIVAGAVALGGVIGKLMGIDVGLATVADRARALTGGSDRAFNDGLVTASVLFCVGPMTLIGCVQDGLEGDSELLRLKSLLDFIASLFLAAVSPAFGAGVLASAAVVLLVQGGLTLGARPLAPIAANKAVMDEGTAAGGAVTLAIGLSLLGVEPVRSLPKEVYLPALVLAPLAAWFAAKRVPKPDLHVPNPEP
ncbi:MAG: DUF554 domain-containing protein [Fimbriimonadaceae bacterium]|nr:DUF554 domain-containing protein [Fimbriimonadaceae bacterium]QYK56717.1 MAG: DUF554 domain-containing protein [Fimbriimonadaceae bacterium]